MNIKDTEKVDLITRARPNKSTLLEKYEIPIEHLSFEYITECTKGKELERILCILRSGEEGIYPELTRHTEKRLKILKPNSKLLTYSEPALTPNMLLPEDRKIIDEDLTDWIKEMQSRDKDLHEGKNNLVGNPDTIPDIRQVDPETSKTKKAPEIRKDNVKRIASCDYDAWNKYDADTEVNKIELREEQARQKLKAIQVKERDKLRKTRNEVTVDKMSLTATEINVLAEQERAKGNEAFRAGDYEEALQLYSSCIMMDSNIAAYNNRAMTYIKLERYKDAIADCNAVIQLEYDNVKAILRRALAMEHLEKPNQALADYETVLKLEPTNKIAIAAVKKLRKPCESKKVRMKIEDLTNKINEGMTFRKMETEICSCNRAPSSSRQSTPLPHFKNHYCLGNDKLLTA